MQLFHPIHSMTHKNESTAISPWLNYTAYVLKKEKEKEKEKKGPDTSQNRVLGTCLNWINGYFIILFQKTGVNII